MLNDYKYSVISKTYITLFFHFLSLPTSNVRMSEGTFCRVEVHIAKLGFAGVYLIFLFLIQNIHCGYSNVYPESMLRIYIFFC